MIEKAKDSKKPQHALIRGIGMANGSNDFLRPSPELLETAIRDALQNSHSDVSQIDFIAASASGSPHCDHQESEVICRVFGKLAQKIPIFPYKSFLGSTFGVQAISEGALAIRTMRDNLVPAPLNIFEPDERIKANVYYRAEDYENY